MEEKGNISHNFPYRLQTKFKGTDSNKPCIAKLDSETNNFAKIIALEDQLSECGLEEGKRTDG